MSREVLRIVAASSFVALAFLNSALAFVALRRLRRDHSARWQDLGEPLPFWNMSVRNRNRVAKFLWSGAYRELNDSRLARLLGAQKVVIVLCVVAFAVFFVTMMK